MAPRPRFPVLEEVAWEGSRRRWHEDARYASESGRHGYRVVNQRTSYIQKLETRANPRLIRPIRIVYHILNSLRKMIHHYFKKIRLRTDDFH